MELAGYYAFAATSRKFEEGTPGYTNLNQAFCALMEGFKESGALDTRPESERESVEHLWSNASALCSLSR